MHKEESMDDAAADAGEIIVLSVSHHLKRVLYLVITSVIVLGGTVIAIRELLAAPLELLYVLPIITIATALGVNTALHMHFTHDSFKSPRPFQYFLAVLGTFECQESLGQWVANHKRHHKHVDVKDLDPHTPYQFGDSKLTVFTIGLLWATIGWKFSRRITSKSYHKLEFLKDPVLFWIDRYFVAISYAGFAIPFIIGYLFGGYSLAIKSFAYYGALRVFVGYFITEFIIDGLCHSLGTEKFRTAGRAKNIAILSPLTFGGTLHHNHHAFPRALSTAVDKSDLDTMKPVNWVLMKCGLINAVQTVEAGALPLRRK